MNKYKGRKSGGVRALMNGNEGCGFYIKHLTSYEYFTVECSRISMRYKYIYYLPPITVFTLSLSIISLSKVGKLDDGHVRGTKWRRR